MPSRSAPEIETRRYDTRFFLATLPEGGPTGQVFWNLEPYRLFWMEDSTPAENQKSFEIVRQHTVTPLAVGEVFNSIWDCKHLIENQLIDYIRTTIVHGGGITHVRRIADFAALHGVRTGFHGATDLSPVCMGAALHFDTWVPNGGTIASLISSCSTRFVRSRRGSKGSTTHRSSRATARRRPSSSNSTAARAVSPRASERNAFPASADFSAFVRASSASAVTSSDVVRPRAHSVLRAAARSPE